MKLRKFGYVEDRFTKKVCSLLNNFYSKLANPPVYVEVLLFEDVERAEKFYISEMLKHGVTISTSHLYYGFHEAWTGIPRIGLICERLRRFDQMLIKAVILHEATHTALHGSIIYYVAPQHLVRTLKTVGLNEEDSLAILQAIFTAIKDLEVTETMCKLGYEEYARRYAMHVTTTTSDEEEEWRRIKGSPYFELLHLTARLKDMLSAAHFYDDMKEHLERQLSYLDSNAKEFLLSITIKARELKGETFEKLEQMIAFYLTTSSSYLRGSL